MVGGIAIALALTASMALSIKQYCWYYLNTFFVAAALVILIAGFIDDLHEISVSAKICVQLIACILLISGGFRTHIIFLNEMANIAVTVAWVLVITNAFNLLDIIDGLCAAIALLVSAGLLCICLINGHNGPVPVLISLIGALSGFLVFNFPPAKAYLGNAGSHFLGLMLAAVSISISYAPSAQRPVALLSPVLIMGFPIFDTLFVAMMRIFKGRPAVRKSKDHLALRFLKLGHSRIKALLIMFASALVFVAAGVIVSVVQNVAGLIVVLVVAAYFVILTIRMQSVSVDG